jgi:alpha-D-ribose 1-methylphosphonate 5-triphosphate synthase subunit PhnL
MDLFRVINDSDFIVRPGKSVVLAGPSGEGCRADIYRFLNVNRLPQSEEKTVHIAGKYRDTGCRSIFHPDCGSFFFSL